MKIVSWNINSLRLRLELLRGFIDEHQPDVVCLQETKCQDSEFPYEAVKSLGFEHVVFKGQKSYNGVAILSKFPIYKAETYKMAGRDDCRHIMAKIEGISIHNFYIPAGGDVPNPLENEKFAHKLDFLADMQARDFGDKAILLGDFNIAPFEHDVWSSKALAKTVSHTPLERETLIKLANNWIDVARFLHPEPQKLYSWWTYRSKDWFTADKGRRLDHIWVTPDLKDSVKTISFIKEMRMKEQPSDHVPVILDIH